MGNFAINPADNKVKISYQDTNYSFPIGEQFTTGRPDLGTQDKLVSCFISPSLPAGLSIDEATCEISGQTSLIFSQDFNVTASTSSSSDTFTINLNSLQVVPSISFSGNPFVFNLFEFSSTGLPLNLGGHIVSCSVTPNLPLGLSLNNTTCEIAGTPLLVSYTNEYAITASNEVGDSASFVMSLAVDNIVPDISLAVSSFQFSLNDTSAATLAPTNNGGGMTSCRVSPPLPAGLSISQTTCRISGTPNAVSSQRSYTLIPGNNMGDGYSLDIDIEVKNIVPAINYNSGAYSFSLNAADSMTDIPLNTGGAITSCSVFPALPAGLSLSQTNCRIHGTPTTVSNNTTYTITANNEIGSSIQVSIDLAVRNIAPNINFANESFDFSLFSSGSTTGSPMNIGGAITDCTVLPSLPAGLSIEATTCKISGTPTAVSSARDYTITASNAIGPGTSQVIHLEVRNIVPIISFNNQSYNFSLFSSTSSTGHPVNTGGDILNCSISPDLPTGLFLDTNTCKISGTPRTLLPLTTFEITPRNEIGYGSYVLINLMVSNIAPILTFSSASYLFNLLDSQANTETPTNSGGAITNCSVTPALPAGLVLDPLSCQISGTPSEVSMATDYRIIASNGVGQAVPQQITIAVANVAPAISYTVTDYNFTLLNLSSGVAPPLNAGGNIDNCSISPMLPSGLIFNPTTCEISGTPTTISNTTTYTITASNEIGSGSAKTISITVTNIVPNIAFSNSSYNFSLFGLGSSTGTPTNSGGAITGCSVTPALPSGLSINATSCAIEGTPLVSTNSMNYTVTPYNEMGSGSSKVISITVTNILPAISFSAASYNFNLYASGSTTGVPTNTGGALIGCTISPPLPAGLSINHLTCEISGTPTVASSIRSYTVTPSSTIGNGTPKVISLTITAIAPSIAYSSNSYSFNLNTSGATTGIPTNTGGALTDCTVSPALPAGLSIFIGTCEILGTPTAINASANYTITPVNSAGSGTPVTLSLAVNDVAPAITYSSSSYNLGLNTPGTTTGIPTKAGGAITNCTVSPTLPTGLSISSTTCAISGTPTTLTALANYTVTPSGAAGSGTPIVISIAVVNSVPGISYSSSRYSFIKSTAATTGTPTYSGGAITGCTISPGLPTGMTINTTTCVISGTATGARTLANYTITPRNAVGNGAAVTISMIFYTNSVVPGQQSYSSTSFVLIRDNPINLIATGPHTSGMPTSCSSVPALPTGLSFTSLCEITGTPTVASGSTNYAITATNSSGSGTSKTLALSVVYAPRITYSSSSYVFNIISSGITTGIPTNTGNTITGCTISPALPSGLSLNTTNCLISGNTNNSPSSTNYTVTPRSGTVSGNPVTINLTINNTVPNLSYGLGHLIWNAGQYNQTGYPIHTGGAITACSVSPALPLGLSVNSQCNLYGTPLTASPSKNYTLTPSNSAGSGAAKVFILEVRDILPDLSYDYTNYSIIRYSYSINTPTSSGGTITSCSIEPALPQGLTFNTTNCTISGFPEVHSPMTSYTITPSSSIGDGTPQVISLEVLSSLAYNRNYSNLTFNFLLNDSGQTSGAITTKVLVSCSISPALPPGLTLNTSNCEITGTPTSLSPSKNYEISANDTSGYTDSVTISISVVENLKPKITYAKSLYNVALESSEIPANTGGRSTSCRIRWVDGPFSVHPTVSDQCEIIDYSPNPYQSNCYASPAFYEVIPSNSAGDGEPVIIQFIYDDLGGC